MRQKQRMCMLLCDLVDFSWCCQWFEGERERSGLVCTNARQIIHRNTILIMVWYGMVWSASVCSKCDGKWIKREKFDVKKKDVEWKCKNKNIIVKIYYQALIYKFLYVTKTEVFKLFAIARVLLCGVWCVVCVVCGWRNHISIECVQMYVWKRLDKNGC